MSTVPPLRAPSTSGLPVPLTRGRDGRWLAGVCTGLARHRKLPVSSVRTAFALAALVGGIGVIAYLACWLIIPADGGDDEAGTTGTRGIVVLAQTCAACVGFATLAAVGAAAAIFGFGWAVLVVAAVILVGALATWPRVGVAWALLPVAALVLPALAMTLGSVGVTPETRSVTIAPQSVADLAPAGYKSGLGSLLVDLRHTDFPTSGNVSLKIHAGVRRTIVALPAGRCVYVDLHYNVVPFAARLASLVTGQARPFTAVTLFGNIQSSRSGEAANIPPRKLDGPILNVYFHSAGGSIYVRDYPDDLNPQVAPDWPGYPVSLEPRPNITGAPRAAATRLIDAWLLRRRVQSASAAEVDRLLPGPCGGIVPGTPTQPRVGIPEWEAVTGGLFEPTGGSAPAEQKLTGGGVPSEQKVTGGAPTAPQAPKAPSTDRHAASGRSAGSSPGATAPSPAVGSASRTAGSPAAGSASRTAGSPAVGSARERRKRAHKARRRP